MSENIILTPKLTGIRFCMSNEIYQTSPCSVVCLCMWLLKYGNSCAKALVTWYLVVVTGFPPHIEKGEN